MIKSTGKPFFLYFCKKQEAKMKILQSSLFRALVAIVVGALLIAYRETATRWLTILIGVLFLVSGIVSCITYYYANERFNKLIAEAEGQTGATKPNRPTLPIVGVGSALLGAILALMPESMIRWMVYLLAVILILGAVSQFVTLAKARSYATVPILYWLFPLIILGTGIYILARPIEAASLPLLVLGWCMVLYGVVEILNTIQVYRMKKYFEKTHVMTERPIAPAEDAEAEEVSSESDGAKKE